MFLGRTHEITALERMYENNNFQMAIVYGRRRIGKTSILNEFIKEKNFIYFPAEEVVDELNLEKFSRIIGEKIGNPYLPTFSNWEDLFSFIDREFNDKKLVLVIDEYPYAATANKALNSTLQHIIDYKFKNSNIFLILCGSSVSFMENHVLGEKSPLFGRRTGQIKVLSMDYLDAAQFYPNVSNELKVKYYAAVGGTPYYLCLIKENLSFEENLKRLYFDINGYLFNEGTLLMKQEFRETATYNTILQAIASGAVTLNEITQFAKLESSTVSRYLGILIDLGFVERVLPFGANIIRGKNSQYVIAENFVAFWYRFVFPYRGEIERGMGDIYLSVALENIEHYTGPIFEEIAKQYLRRQNFSRKLPFIAKSFGKWWGKDKDGRPQDVDVLVESIDGKELVIAECKWKNQMKTKQVIDKLKERSLLFSEYTNHLYLFSKIEVSSRDGVRIIGIEDLFK